ncbi:unnamed protein product [Mytilus coruscus]|uniref:Uncharacterized protein n=1 Tax=Mytilus coruscus TaxID=42192 RepID=A0A6J8CHK5_MYTCO|nr:unnamed protein product [Mytilus coruscus]
MEIRDQYSNEYGELEKLHYKQLCHFIKHTIETVVEEHTLEASENAFLDNIDKNTHNEERREDILICALCGTENTRRKLVCEGCKKKGIKEARTKISSDSDKDDESDNDDNEEDIRPIAKKPRKKLLSMNSSTQLTRDADVHCYTGLHNTDTFKELFDHFSIKAYVIQYWKGARLTVKDVPMRY